MPSPDALTMSLCLRTSSPRCSCRRMDSSSSTYKHTMRKKGRLRQPSTACKAQQNAHMRAALAAAECPLRRTGRATSTSNTAQRPKRNTRHHTDTPCDFCDVTYVHRASLQYMLMLAWKIHRRAHFRRTRARPDTQWYHDREHPLKITPSHHAAITTCHQQATPSP